MEITIKLLLLSFLSAYIGGGIGFYLWWSSLAKLYGVDKPPWWVILIWPYFLF